MHTLRPSESRQGPRMKKLLEIKQQAEKFLVICEFSINEPERAHLKEAYANQISYLQAILRLVSALEKAVDQRNLLIDAAWSDMYKEQTWNQEAVERRVSSADSELLAILEVKP